MGLDAMFVVFWMLSFKPTFSLSSFTFIKRLFSYSLSAIRVVSSAYLRLLIFLPAIVISACASSSPTIFMMYSAYKLHKQGHNMQPWRTPFSIWNQSVVRCPVLTVASWPSYRFLKKQVWKLRWYYKVTKQQSGTMWSWHAVFENLLLFLCFLYQCDLLGFLFCCCCCRSAVQLCLTLCDSMDHTVHGILQARILEWVDFPFSRGYFQPRDRTQVSCIAGRFFTSWATREAHRYDTK